MIGGLVRSSNETDEGDVDTIIGGWIVPRGHHKYMASTLQRGNDTVIVVRP
jgi:hypothetical protein